MNSTATLQHLMADLKDEVRHQGALLGLLAEQVDALHATGPEGLEQINERLEEAFQSAQARHARRERLVGGLAASTGAPTRVTTLGSLIERIGQDAAPLAAVRKELRSVCAEVLKRARRNGALIAAHRRVTGDVLEGLLGDTAEQEATGAGVLVDAKV